MIILPTFFIHGKLTVIIKNGAVRVRITGFLSRNLPPGSYTCRFVPYPMKRYKTYETRDIQIVITPPAWASVWAMVGYAILLILVMVIIFRIIMLQKQKKVSDEKTRFFINTLMTYVHHLH